MVNPTALSILHRYNSSSSSKSVNKTRHYNYSLLKKTDQISDRLGSKNPGGEFPISLGKRKKIVSGCIRNRNFLGQCHIILCKKLQPFIDNCTLISANENL